MFVAVLPLGSGCSVAPPVDKSPAHAAAGSNLAPEAAARLAASLANDECERLYRRRPFAAHQHHAKPESDGYRWGGLDVVGVNGFSALVTFRPDGSQPSVEVYYSTDRLFQGTERQKPTRRRGD